MYSRRFSDRFFIIFGLITLVLGSLACGSTATEELVESSIPVQNVSETSPPTEDATSSEQIENSDTSLVTENEPDEPESSEIAEPEDDEQPTAEPTVAPTSVPLEEAEEPILVKQGFGQEDRSVAYAFLVENPNESVGLEDIGYQIAAKDSEGTVIATDSSSITAILPSQTIGVAGSIFVEEGDLVSTLEIQLSNADEVAADQIDTFTVDRINYLEGDFSNSATGVISSPYSRSFDDVRVSAITYNESGEINGGGFTFLHFAPASNHVGVSVDVTSSGSVSNVEIYPVLSILSLFGSEESIPSDAEPIELVKQGFGEDEFSSSYGFLIRNPNTTYSIESSKYYITAYDSEGNVIGTDYGYIEVLLPEQELGIGGTVFSKNNAQIASIETQILEGTYVESQNIEGFSSEGATYLPGDFSSEVTGTLINPFTAEVTNLRVSALAFDEAGNIIGGGFTFLDFIPAQGSSPVTVSISSGTTPFSVELYATISALSEMEE